MTIPLSIPSPMTLLDEQAQLRATIDRLADANQRLTQDRDREHSARLAAESECAYLHARLAEAEAALELLAAWGRRSETERRQAGFDALHANRDRHASMVQELRTHHGSREEVARLEAEVERLQALVNCDCTDAERKRADVAEFGIACRNADVDHLRTKNRELAADRDRWAARVRVLEERAAKARKVLG